MSIITILVRLSFCIEEDLSFTISLDANKPRSVIELQYSREKFL